MRVSREARERFEVEALPHLNSLYRTALHFTKDPALSDDLVQETFKEAWRSFHNYRPGSNCKAWLFRIFFRTRSRHFRALNKVKQIALDDLPEKMLVAPDFRSAVEAKLVLKILDTLPDHYQMVLVLADIENLSYREIAETLELPVGTIMSRLNRARAFLRSKLCQSEAKSSQAG